VSIHSEQRQTSVGDLSRLRIDRDVPRRRRWVPWLALALLIALAAALYPSARAYYDQQRAPEVDIARATLIAAQQGGGRAPVPVLVATGYVVARRSSDVGVKTGGRLQSLTFQEGTRVTRGDVIARIEHADLDAQLAASQAAMAEAETQVAQADTQVAQAEAAHAEDLRQLERQRALAKEGITTNAALTTAEAAADVSAARVRAGQAATVSARAAIVSARARIRVIEESIENTNIRAPFDGVVIKKRAEIGETVSPFGVAGQAAREGGAIATIADLRELEVQTEVGENSVAKIRRGMTAAVKLQAYPDTEFRGRVREIFPSADRAKAIVEVRVTIVDATPNVKPEMTASVTFQEPPAAAAPAVTAAAPATAVIVPKRAVFERDGHSAVWVVTAGVAVLRTVTPGAVRLDQIEITNGLAPGEAVILSPPATVADHGRVKAKGA
jgi:RND family efflux transporter MFP subunit